MKTKITKSFFLLGIFFSTSILSQPWFTGGNNLAPGDFMGSTNNTQVVFKSNNFNRMIIDGGTGGFNSGRIAMGNNLPAGFAPQARLHLHQTGSIFSTIDTYVRFTNSFTGPTSTDGFSIGNSNSGLGPFGDVLMIQNETAPIIAQLPNANLAIPSNTVPYEWFRIQNGVFTGTPTAASYRPSDGYIGLNNSAPRSHIEMITPAFQGGEEFFMAKPSDTNFPNVQMGMMNATSNNNQFLPTLFGNLNHPTQNATALEMVGSISSAQDIPSNTNIVERFIVGKDWIINQNSGSAVGTPTSPIASRTIFGWMNATILNMYMNANGQMRLGFNLFVSNPAQPIFRANNRFEITADVIDPYFNPNGNTLTSGNPNLPAGINWGSASGLRFTLLTSNDLVIVPNATNQIDPSKVLSVDRNGDVVAIYPAIGAACTNTFQIAAQTFSTSRAVNQGTFNMEWRGQGRNGFGTTNCTVGNRVEITGLNSFSSTPGGNSGLRFTNMTSTTTAITNPTSKVLSVNANGDVILVTDQTGTVVGSGSVAAQNGLTLVGTNTVELGGTLIHPTSIDFNNFDLRYHNGANLNLYVREANGSYYMNALKPNQFKGSSEVSFYEDATATSPGSAYGRDLFLAAQGSTTSAFFLVGTRVTVNTFPTPTVSITGKVVGNWSRVQNTGSNAGDNYAFKAEANGAGPGMINVGYFGAAGGSQRNYGVYTEISNPPQAIEDNGVRVFSQSNLNTTTNVGGYFNALQGQNVYGIFAQASGGSGTNYAGYFQGQTYFNGNINGVGTFAYSDQTLKTNIDTISNAIGIIKQLKPKTFYFDTTNISKIKFSSKKQYGLIAQDVELILPELVGHVTKPDERDSLGNVITPAVTYKNLNYDSFIAILLKGMQSQQRTIEKQDSVMKQMQTQISNLTSSVTSCCSSSAVRQTSPAEQNQLSVNLSDKDIIVLNQNAPNPFAEQTTITYNVPEKYGYAQMIFSTIDGRILRTVDITKKGRGTITVYSNDLSSGMYSYSLVVDGKTFDTKKMMKSE